MYTHTIVLVRSHYYALSSLNEVYISLWGVFLDQIGKRGVLTGPGVDSATVELEAEQGKDSVAWNSGTDDGSSGSNLDSSGTIMGVGVEWTGGGGITTLKETRAEGCCISNVSTQCWHSWSTCCLNTIQLSTCTRYDTGPVLFNIVAGIHCAFLPGYALA